MFYINNEIETDVRFDTIKFFNFNVDNIDPLDSYFISNIQKLPATGTYTIVSEDKRPDLVSYQLYEDTQYWWILMIYNKILDISEFSAGTDIVYPDKSLLETLYQNASLLRKTE